MDTYWTQKLGKCPKCFQNISKICPYLQCIQIMSKRCPCDVQKVSKFVYCVRNVTKSESYFGHFLVAFEEHVICLKCKCVKNVSKICLNFWKSKYAQNTDTYWTSLGHLLHMIWTHCRYGHIFDIFWTDFRHFPNLCVHAHAILRRTEKASNSSNCLAVRSNKRIPGLQSKLRSKLYVKGRIRGDQHWTESTLSINGKNILCTPRPRIPTMSRFACELRGSCFMSSRLDVISHTKPRQMYHIRYLFNSTNFRPFPESSLVAWLLIQLLSTKAVTQWWKTTLKLVQCLCGPNRQSALSFYFFIRRLLSGK